MSFPHEIGIGEHAYLQEDIQLLPDIVDCGDFGLGFLDRLVLSLLELLSLFFESRVQV